MTHPDPDTPQILYDRRKNVTPCMCTKEPELQLLDYKFEELIKKMGQQSTQLDIIIGKLPAIEIRLDEAAKESGELDKKLEQLAISHYEYKDKFNYWFARGITIWGVLVFAAGIGAWGVNKWVDRVEHQAEREYERQDTKAKEDLLWRKTIQDQLDSIKYRR